MPRLDWERLDERGSAPFNLNTGVARAQVPGGWLVRYISLGEKEHITVVFVADPEYTWSQQPD